MRRDEFEAGLEKFGKDLKRGLHTISPGYIESYDPERRVCSVVVPFTDFLQTDGETPINLDWKPIPDCPVWYLGGGGFVVAPPLKKGDPCLVLFCQRDIDKWWQGDGQTVVTPALVDTHTESDAIVLAGLLMPQQAVLGEADGESLQISHNSSAFHMKVTPDGEVQIKASKVRLGTLDANKSLALTEKVDARIDALEGKIGNLVAGAAAAIGAGGLWLTVVDPLAPQASVNSETVFTNA